MSYQYCAGSRAVRLHNYMMITFVFERVRATCVPSVCIPVFLCLPVLVCVSVCLSMQRKRERAIERERERERERREEQEKGKGESAYNSGMAHQESRLCSGGIAVISLNAGDTNHFNY